MANRNYSMVQVGHEHHHIMCGHVKIADVHSDRMGHHYLQASNDVMLEPRDLAYMLDRLLHLDTQDRTVQ